MTQRQNVTLSLTEISTFKINFLLETFQLPKGESKLSKGEGILRRRA